MAVIQRLRNSGWVAVVIITALVLFVVGDWLTGRQGNGNANENRDVIAEIRGEKVREAEISVIVEKLYKKEMDQDPNFKLDEAGAAKLFQSAWTELLKSKVMLKDIALSGIEISDADFNEMVVGANPISAIQNDPSFQTDGKFDPSKVESIFKQAKGNAQMKVRLAEYVEQLKAQELETRYATYIAKSLAFKTKKELAYDYVAANQTVEGKLVALNISTIADKDIKVTDEDLKEYLDDNKERFKIKSEARSFKFVVFDIIPSSDDSAQAKEEAYAAAKRMAGNTTDTIGAIGYINRTNLDEKTPTIVVDSLWNSAIGRVVGPVYKDGKYSIYQKVAEAKDSFPMVNVSHILIPLSGELPNGTVISDSTQALAIAQNVYNQVAGGKTIAELASTYSSDKSSAVNGGSYGWADPRQYVEAYKKFCLEAKKNQLGLVKTEYGYHIMRMMEEPDYRKIKYQVEETEVAPGQKTVKLVDEKSRKFKNLVNPDKPETFDKAVEKLGIIPRVGNNFTFDQKSVGGIDNYSDVRTLIYWLFDDKRENNEISEVFAFPNKHVIVKLENIKHIGYATVDNVRSEIEGTVKEQLKCKKAAEKLENAMKTAKTADALAKAVNGDLIDLNVVRYGQGFLPQIGQEFGVLGAIYGMGETKVSKPILGKQVAAVIFMNKTTKMDIPVSIYNAPQEDSYTNQPQFVLNRLQEVLTRSAAIQDFRYKFDWYK